MCTHATILSFLKVFNRLGRVWMDATKTARRDVAMIWSGKQKEKQLNEETFAYCSTCHFFDVSNSL